MILNYSTYVYSIGNRDFPVSVLGICYVLSKGSITLQYFPATCWKYCNFKIIFYQVEMGNPLKIYYISGKLPEGKRISH